MRNYQFSIFPLLHLDWNCTSDFQGWLSANRQSVCQFRSLRSIFHHILWLFKLGNKPFEYKIILTKNRIVKSVPAWTITLQLYESANFSSELMTGPNFVTDKYDSRVPA